MLKLLYIAEGLDRSETAMIEAMQSRGHQTQLLLADSADPNQPIPAKVSVARIPLSGRYNGPSIRKIRSVIKTTTPDIIHTLRNNRPLTNTLVAAIGQPKPAIIAYRGTVGHLSLWDPAARLSYLNPRINAIVCVSEAVRQYLLTRRIPPHKLITIHKGHRSQWYRSLEPHDRQSMQIPQDCFLLCCAANMRPVKGIRYLINALHHLPDHVHLLLIGEVQDPAIKDAAQDPMLQPRLHFAGFRDDATQLIGMADAFVMPSTHREGLPRAVIEAMAQAIPPIVTQVGGMPELVIDHQSGLQVSPRNAKAIAEAALKLIHDPHLATTLGQQARERIEGPFSIEHSIDRTEQLYKRLTST